MISTLLLHVLLLFLQLLIQVDGLQGTPFLRPLENQLQATPTKEVHLQEGPADRRKQRKQRLRHPLGYSQRDQLHRVLQSITYYGTHPGDNEPGASEIVLEAVKDLTEARTQAEYAKVGRHLESLKGVVESESWDIRERLLKATALCGLLSLSIQIFHQMLDESRHAKKLPSHMAYLALCSALRRTGNKDVMEELLMKAAKVGRSLDGDGIEQNTINVVALNTLLASLCRDAKRPDDAGLAKAFHWLKTPGLAKEQFYVVLDTTSYNTVLQAAARVGNATMSDAIWASLKTNDCQVKPDARTYNFRLQSLRQFEDQLALFDEMLLDTGAAPDRFTIDLVILPLIRAGRVGDVESLLEQFIEQNSVEVASEAFSAFLLTLVKKGELSSARALFGTYVMPNVGQLKEIGMGNSSYSMMVHSIEPDVRHFNVLIDGYRGVLENLAILEGKTDELGEDTADFVKRRQDNKKRRKKKIWQKKDEPKSNNGDADDERKMMSKDVALYEGRKLYRIMVKAEIKPDAYTITSMMGLCKSMEEMLKLIEQSNVSITPAITRAAITNCGRLGDPSSACVLFDTYATGSRDLRLWNVLLNALSEGAKTDGLIIDVESSPVNKDAAPRLNITSDATVSSLINGMSCTDACREVLAVMSEATDNKANARAPKPNSQTYCLVASALQYESKGAEDAMALFFGAIDSGIPADGRFVNAIFRCFGDDIDGALDCWKDCIRKECLAYESRTRRYAVSVFRSKNKNLIAAYNGLMYVCGRALRPDIALRLAFAMDREGIEPNEICLNNYNAGKRLRKKLQRQQQEMEPRDTSGRMPKLLPKLNLESQYESLLYVECTKYDRFNKRMANDKRVRIIV